jgi:hypothetical protein
LIEIVEYFGGTVGKDSALVNEELKELKLNTKTANQEQRKAATEASKLKAHAIAFLKRADKGQCRQLLTDLENQFTRGMNQHPTTITKACNLLVNFKKVTVARERPRTPRGTGNERRNLNDRNNDVPNADELTFVQRGEPADIATMQCYNCQGFGH